jgi:glutaredoxin
MIVLYVLDGCPYCEKALGILKTEKIQYEKIVVPNEEIVKKTFKKKCSMDTFPMIFIETEEKNHFIQLGGSSDLEEYIRKSKEIKESLLGMDKLYLVYKNLYSKN